MPEQHDIQSLKPKEVSQSSPASYFQFEESW